MREKIKVKSPLVEMDGDEMTRVMWHMIKEKLILPYLDVDLKYFDLHVKHRDETNDEVTLAAAEATRKYGVAVKCATITATDDRVREYGLKRKLPSPNATIRAALDGTIFREPILVKNIEPFIKTWKKPIIIGRHAYGDVYSAAEMHISSPGKAEMVFSPADGSPPLRKTIHEFQGEGIIQGLHNTAVSIWGFAQACFSYAYERKVDLWFSAKDTISGTYDAYFRSIFDRQYELTWKEKFEKAGIEYFFTLIDDAVARVVRSEGGFLWALKNYDGDVMSDMVASAVGSLAMMTSVLVSPYGCYEYEAAHGTVQRHYYRHLKGEPTSTNPMALIFAWTGGLRKRGEMDGTPEVMKFAEALEEAAKDTIEAGIMTGDLIAVARPSPNNRQVNTEEFMAEIARRLREKLTGEE
ncbi:MAG TPA: NADP-dependent isocitrate dehydrogenase [Syntrophales bacterium]|nr:NADP-dependent isocitrate dehydrogenase [Syntrophales bacterium]HOL58785.1 NADP-dependent isocitrate dehydrogenase [Syntrophales bacterium]HPO35112.1 NADP-dependent isocitrate dehydrogenase [Syntrophales bacterium]